MARFAFLAVLLTACASIASAIPSQEPLNDLSDKWHWTDCGMGLERSSLRHHVFTYTYSPGNPTDPLRVTSISISPDPPKPGEELTVTVTGEATTTIEASGRPHMPSGKAISLPSQDGAYADVAVKVGRIKILQKEFDLCDEA